MGKVTITLDEETARWARTEAAKQGISISCLVGGILTEHMKSAAAYERARRSHSNRSANVLQARDGAYPARSEIHSR